LYPELYCHKEINKIINFAITYAFENMSVQCIVVR